jgi:hypothetical protein
VQRSNALGSGKCLTSHFPDGAVGLIASPLSALAVGKCRHPRTADRGQIQKDRHRHSPHTRIVMMETGSLRRVGPFARKGRRYCISTLHYLSRRVWRSWRRGSTSDRQCCAMKASCYGMLAAHSVTRDAFRRRTRAPAASTHKGACVIALARTRCAARHQLRTRGLQLDSLLRRGVNQIKHNEVTETRCWRSPGT